MSRRLQTTDAEPKNQENSDRNWDQKAKDWNEINNNHEQAEDPDIYNSREPNDKDWNWNQEVANWDGNEAGKLNDAENVDSSSNPEQAGRPTADERTSPKKPTAKSFDEIWPTAFESAHLASHEAWKPTLV